MPAGNRQVRFYINKQIKFNKKLLAAPMQTVIELKYSLLHIKILW